MMLKFNPNDRHSAKEILSFPIFNNIRVKELEEDSPIIIKIDFDENLDSNNHPGNYGTTFFNELQRLIN